eukprot:TRINITY_DN6570_c0_g1_i5.p1 TRINITY_DN6570_c0_g1~~TRINITY_DN6570_c0_g1_i5.p1  ORF type:complete len:1235 (+),score=233.81 TRINITY_DN6570_c0_g1_i5:402-4106(+)
MITRRPAIPQLFFSTAEKEYMIHHTIRSAKVQAADVAAYPQMKLHIGQPLISCFLSTKSIVDMYFLHNWNLKNKFADFEGISESRLPTFFRRMRKYGGDHLAFYLAWHDHYNKHLHNKDAVSIIVGLIGVSWALGLDWTITLAFAVSIWSTVTLESWKDKHLQLVLDWGISMMEAPPLQVSKLSGMWIYDETLGTVIKKTSIQEKFLRLVASYVGTLVLAFLTISLQMLFQKASMHPSCNIIFCILIFATQAACSYGASQIFKKALPEILEVANFSYPKQVDHHSVNYYLIFEIPNRVAGPLASLMWSRNILLLNIQLAIYLAAFSSKTILRFWKGKGTSSTSFKEEEFCEESPRPLTDQINVIFSSPLDMEVTETIVAEAKKAIGDDDSDEFCLHFADIGLQIAIIGCFAFSAPWLPYFFYTYNNLSWKYMIRDYFEKKKAIPRLGSPVGTWMMALDVVSIAAVAVNFAAYALSHMNELNDLFAQSKALTLLFGIVLEHVLVGFKYVSHLYRTYGTDNQTIVQRKQIFDAAQSHIMMQDSQTALHLKKHPTLPSSLPPYTGPNFSLPLCMFAGYVLGSSLLGLFLLPFIYYGLCVMDFFEEKVEVGRFVRSHDIKLGKSLQDFGAIESTEWLNYLVHMGWNRYAEMIESNILEKANAAMKMNLPNFLSALRLQSVLMGTVAPRLRGIRVLGQRDHERLCYEADVEFCGDASVAIFVARKGFSATIHIRDVYVLIKQLRFYVAYSHNAPFIESIAVHFGSAPVIDASILLPVIGNFFDIPFLNSMIKNIIREELESALVRKVIEEKIDASQSNYVLDIILKKGEDFPVADLNGLSDPYCVLKVGSETLTSSVQKHTLNPDWGAEKFSFNVTYTFNDGVKEKALLKFYDKDLRHDDFLGSVSLGFHELRPLQIIHHTYDLMDAPSGFVEIEAMLRPAEGHQMQEGYLSLSFRGITSSQVPITGRVYYMCTLRGSSLKTTFQDLKEGAGLQISAELPVPHLGIGILKIEIFRDSGENLGFVEVDLALLVSEGKNEIKSRIRDGAGGQVVMTIDKLHPEQRFIESIFSVIHVTALEYRGLISESLEFENESHRLQTQIQTKIQKGSSWLKKKAKISCMARVGSKREPLSLDDVVPFRAVQFPVKDMHNQNLFIALTFQPIAQKELTGTIMIPLKPLISEVRIDRWYPVEFRKSSRIKGIPELRLYISMDGSMPERSKYMTQASTKDLGSTSNSFGAS